MKSEAIVLRKKHKGNKAFEQQEWTLAPLGDDQIQLKSEAFGLNYADVMASLGLYREAPPRPCVIGYELVGEIVAVGKNLDSNIIGKRALAFTRFGGYAQMVNVEKYAFVLLGTKENEPAEECLALATQGATAYYMACHHSPIRQNDVVLIHAAAGGVGTLLIQLCKKAGATVIAKVSSAEKARWVKALGADLVIDYQQTADYSAEITKWLGKRRITASFNPIAGATFKKDMQLLGFGGKIYLYGGAELSGGKWGVFSALNFIRKMGRPLPIAHMMKSQSIIGVNMLKVADFQPEVMSLCLQNCMDLYRDKTLVPQVGGKYPVAEVQQALELLESGKSKGKLSVFW